MEPRKAVIALSQSEKVKSGLLWISHCIQLLEGLAGLEKAGADKVIRSFVGMVAHEIQLAGKLTGDSAWLEAEKHLDLAIVMINSQVPLEAGFHLTRALSHVTSIGERNMSFLKSEGIF